MNVWFNVNSLKDKEHVTELKVVKDDLLQTNFNNDKNNEGLEVKARGLENEKDERLAGTNHRQPETAYKNSNDDSWLPNFKSQDISTTPKQEVYEIYRLEGSNHQSQALHQNHQIKKLISRFTRIARTQEKLDK